MGSNLKPVYYIFVYPTEEETTKEGGGEVVLLV